MKHVFTFIILHKKQLPARKMASSALLSWLAPIFIKQAHKRIFNSNLYLKVRQRLSAKNLPIKSYFRYGDDCPDGRLLPDVK